MSLIYVVRQDIGASEDFWPLCVTLDKEKAEARLAESKSNHGEYWMDTYDSETGELAEQGDVA